MPILNGEKKERVLTSHQQPAARKELNCMEKKDFGSRQKTVKIKVVHYNHINPRFAEGTNQLGLGMATSHDPHYQM